MDELKIINEIIFNIKQKITDNEYLLLTKNLYKLYKKQKHIDNKPMIESQHSLRQYYRYEEPEDITNYYDNDSDSDIESYYSNVNNVEEWELEE